MGCVHIFIVLEIYLDFHLSRYLKSVSESPALHITWSHLSWHRPQSSSVDVKQPRRLSTTVEPQCQEYQCQYSGGIEKDLAHNEIAYPLNLTVGFSRLLRCEDRCKYLNTIVSIIFKDINSIKVSVKGCRAILSHRLCAF